MEPSKETKASEGKTELEQHEKDVLEDLEDEGIEMPTNVTEVLDSLPEEQKHVIVRALYAVGKSSSFRGPLPPPEILKGYEEILPGASERILKMAEKQQDHRIDIERTIVDRQTRQSGNGQIWGGILAALFGLIALVLGYTGHDILAGGIATTTIICLAIIFVLHKAPTRNIKNEEDVSDDES